MGDLRRQMPAGCKGRDIANGLLHHLGFRVGVQFVVLRSASREPCTTVHVTLLLRNECDQNSDGKMKRERRSVTCSLLPVLQSCRGLSHRRSRCLR